MARVEMGEGKYRIFRGFDLCYDQTTRSTLISPNAGDPDDIQLSGLSAGESILPNDAHHLTSSKVHIPFIRSSTLYLGCLKERRPLFNQRFYSRMVLCGRPAF